MRHPLLHEFFKWLGVGSLAAPTTVLVAYAALAAAHEDVAKWGEEKFQIWWPVMTAGWFLILVGVYAVSLLAAVLYTGTNGRNNSNSTRSTDSAGGHGVSVSGNARVKLRNSTFSDNAASGLHVDGEADVDAENVRGERNGRKR